jgi:hypothetical protein
MLCRIRCLFRADNKLERLSRITQSPRWNAKEQLSYLSGRFQGKRWGSIGEEHRLGGIRLRVPEFPKIPGSRFVLDGTGDRALSPGLNA